MGIISEFELEEGGMYRVVATLGPLAKLRLHNGHGKPMMLFESVVESPQMTSHRFTFDKDWEGRIVVMAQGEVNNLNFEMVGIDTRIFK